MNPSSNKPDLSRIASNTPHYQTFPTKPPKSRGKPQTSWDDAHDGSASHPRSTSSRRHHTPLPTRQLVVLAIIALAEQTALNSIAPYLPDMVSSFPDVQEDLVGTYVGLVASSFALAQFATNFFWGWLSDRIGRKPVILTGTLLTAACFVAFGFCQTLAQAIIVQAFMGLVNGNQGVVSTCLGEITDRSNQSEAFTYLPVVYGLGGITGPIVGGLLVHKSEHKTSASGHPYLAPNLLSAGVLLTDLLVTIFFLEESLEELREMPPLSARANNLFTWLWQFASYGRRPKHMSDSGPTSRSFHHPQTGHDTSDTESEEYDVAILPTADNGHLQAKDVLNRDVVIILVTFLIFQLSNIAYNSLYPIFAQAHPPIGRDLSPEEIGLSLAFAGVITIIFQVGIFGHLRDKIGNKITYRLGLAGFVIAFLLMPWVGYKDSNDMAMSSGRIWLWLELGIVLIIKTVASVGGLTSALLLVRPLDLLSPRNFTDMSNFNQDNEFSSRSYSAWYTEWPSSDSVRGWASTRPVSFWWTFLSLNSPSS